jgi:hypothetical protein
MDSKIVIWNMIIDNGWKTHYFQRLVIIQDLCLCPKQANGCIFHFIQFLSMVRIQIHQKRT